MEHECNENSSCRYYNDEHIMVCSISGECFTPRMCDDYVDSSRGIINCEVSVYSNAQKRNQQVKNRKIELNEIMDIINDIDFLKKYSLEIINDFANQIKELWKIFIEEVEKYDFYVHRNARRCFVVSIIYNLKYGLYTIAGCVIKDHNFIKVTNLNKKKTYKFFKIRDIRYGQNIIKKILAKRKCVPIQLRISK